MITPDSGKKRHFLPIGAFLFWVAVWQAAAMAVGNMYILPSPWAVLKTLAALSSQAAFWISVLYSLSRILLGFLCGVAAGTLLAAATLRFRAADALISPLLRVVRATPVASFIILAILWIGRNGVPAFTAALMVTPLVWGNVTHAVEKTDKAYLEMAEAYRFGPGRKLRLIYVPTALPAWRAACLTGIGLAWKAGIAAEVLCQPPDAIGAKLYYAKIYIETPALFAWTAVVIALSFTIEKGFAAVVGRRGGG